MTAIVHFLLVQFTLFLFFTCEAQLNAAPFLIPSHTGRLLFLNTTCRKLKGNANVTSVENSCV